MTPLTRLVPTLALLCLGTACTTVLPDVAPFAQSTVNLRCAVATAGDAVIDEVDRARVRSERRHQLERAWARRNEIMAAMVVYADSLTAIVESGRANAETSGAVVDLFARFAGSVGHPVGPGAELASDVVKSIARQMALARARDNLEETLSVMQPAVEQLAEVLEQDLRDLDRVLLGAGRENELEFLDRDDFKGLDQQRGRLFAFLRGFDPDRAGPDDMSKAAGVAAMLEATNPLAVRRDAGLTEIRDRIRRVRQILQETRVCVRVWAITHQNLVAAVRSGSVVDVAGIVDIAQQINDLVGRIRDT